MKTCTKCEIVRDDFHKNKRNKDGLDHWCNECRVAYNRQWKTTLKGISQEKINNKKSYQKKVLIKERGFCPRHNKTQNVENHKCCQRCLWFQQEANLKHFFNITVEDYARMEYAQNRVCKVCEELCASGRGLAVDHCHETGRVRGLLCGSCNRVLGQLGNGILKKFESYLG